MKRSLTSFIISLCIISLCCIPAFATGNSFSWYCVRNKDHLQPIADANMRFVEDQFVVWGEFANWTISDDGERHTPAGLEQYYCYVPIDASSATIMRSFMSMYSLTHERLLIDTSLTCNHKRGTLKRRIEAHDVEKKLYA